MVNIRLVVDNTHPDPHETVKNLCCWLKRMDAGENPPVEWRRDQLNAAIALLNEGITTQ